MAIDPLTGEEVIIPDGKPPWYNQPTMPVKPDAGYTGIPTMNPPTAPAWYNRPDGPLTGMLRPQAGPPAPAPPLGMPEPQMGPPAPAPNVLATPQASTPPVGIERIPDWARASWDNPADKFTGPLPTRPDAPQARAPVPYQGGRGQLPFVAPQTQVPPPSVAPDGGSIENIPEWARASMGDKPPVPPTIGPDTPDGGGPIPAGWTTFHTPSGGRVSLPPAAPDGRSPSDIHKGVNNPTPWTPEMKDLKGRVGKRAEMSRIYRGLQLNGASKESIDSELLKGNQTQEEKLTTLRNLAAEQRTSNTGPNMRARSRADKNAVFDTETGEPINEPSLASNAFSWADSYGPDASLGKDNMSYLTKSEARKFNNITNALSSKTSNKKDKQWLDNKMRTVDNARANEFNKRKADDADKLYNAKLKDIETRYNVRGNQKSYNVWKTRESALRANVRAAEKNAMLAGGEEALRLAQESLNNHLNNPPSTNEQIINTLIDSNAHLGWDEAKARSYAEEKGLLR